MTTITRVLVCFAILAACFGVMERAQAATPAPLPAPDARELKLGQRIYREGILPSGDRVKVAVTGNSALPGLTFSCAGCHLKSGLGALDEGVFYPPVNGDKLFQPLTRTQKLVRNTERPAYTDETLIQALTSGKDPSGRVLSDTMPRYQLEERDARLLVAYLRSLSTGLAPGVTDKEIRFATVVSEDVGRELRGAMLTPMDYYFTLKNPADRSYVNPRKGAFSSRLLAEKMLMSRKVSAKDASLVVWTLKGSPEGWREQLEAYYQKEPVFALVGGLVRGPWQPIHQFCEENEIPAVLPNTELPVISETSWYTLYQSKGYYQEGEGAARFLNERPGGLPAGTLIQVVAPGAEARAMADGFLKTWQELGHQGARTVELDASRPLDRGLLQDLVAREKPGVLLVWGGAQALPALETLPGLPQRPELILLSARLLGDSLYTMSEPLRELAFLTYPYSSIKARSGGGKKLMRDDRQSLPRDAVPFQSEARTVTGQTEMMNRFLRTLLMDLRGSYYRDNLIDVAGMMEDQSHPLYGPVSFRSGGRYAANGCFVVQLSPGRKPELLKRSGWLTR